MKSILVGILILASSLVQLSYAEPYHHSAARKSYNQQLDRRAPIPLDQDNWLGGTGNWSNGSDWSLNAPPGSGDDATIGGANDFVSFDVGTTTINSLTLAGTLTDRGIASGFTASSFLNVTSTGVLDFSSSGISLPGEVQGSVNYGKMSAAFLNIGTDLGGGFSNYGVLNLGGLAVNPTGGQFFNAPGASLTTGGAGLGYLRNYGHWDNFGQAGGGYPDGGGIDNYGVLHNHSTGYLYLGYEFGLRNYGTLTNDGTIYIDSISGGGYINSFGTFINNGTVSSFGFAGNDGIFVNNGTFSGDGGGSGSVVNHGTFNVFATLGNGFSAGSYVQEGSQSVTTVDDGVFSATTPLQINGGTLSGNGIIAGDVNMSGRLTPGYGSSCQGCRVLTIQGNYQQFGIGTFNSELGGTRAGWDYDQLAITGNAILDGTLDVTLLTTFVPKLGDAFLLMTYGSESGKFSMIDLPALPSGEMWNYAYESSDFKLWVVPEPSSLVLLGGGLLGMVGMVRRKLS